MSKGIERVDEDLAGVPPWKVVAGTAGTCLAIHYVYTILGNLCTKCHNSINLFSLIKKLRSKEIY